ncbi:MAG: glycosyltransferase [Prevotella sp.]|nr:glycosyltransferase [Prevotella sp.]
MKGKNPRLLFAIHYLELGGAEISLIGLLRTMDYTKYDVDLFVYSHQGELMRYIPKEVHLLPEIKTYAYIERPMKDALSKGLFGVVWGRLKAKWQHKRWKMEEGRRKNLQDASIFQYVMNNVEPYLPSLDQFGEYDLAVSFLTPHNIVLNKVRAKRKVCWIHTDYSKIDVNTEIELPVWSKFDRIVSISADVTKAFLTVFPTLKDKIVEIHNILSADFVRSRAEEMTPEEVAKEMPREAGVINLLSVGRFTHPKNYDNVPAILSSLNVQCSMFNVQCHCRWYLIGYGGEESLIRQRIVEEGMEGQVIILGKKENPYPYIKACDIYVQPSRYEGNAVTVREAQMLGKPVVVTNYPTATSQIQDGIDGVIVPMDNKGCAKGIAEFLNDKVQQQSMVSYLLAHDYSNTTEIEKLYKLL